MLDHRYSCLRAWGLCIVTVALAACSQAPESSAIKVEIVASDAGYILHRGGERYDIHGAGLEYGDFESLAAHGGNSIRTWTTSNDVETAQEVLDKAFANDVTVALCLPMQAERWGFDYNDAAAVSAQLALFTAEVEKYKDHPALLAWIIGNELNFDYKNASVYDAVNDVSKMIHALDPNHPPTTTVAGLGENVLKDVSERAPDLDFISFQVYGELAILPEFIAETGYSKPFFVTEWGAIGHWEMPKTSWGAPIEMTSSEKANVYREGNDKFIKPLSRQLIGSYAFLWGQKQERTPTWFGMFTEAGEETEVVDVMHFIWNGEWPENRSPQVRSMLLGGKSAHGSVSLRSGETVEAAIDAFDADGDTLSYRWEVKPESDTRQVGGDFEKAIASLDDVITDAAATRTRIVAPAPGAYRLFVYVYDGQNNAAHANIPFLVSN
jgi:hypothetical protein